MPEGVLIQITGGDVQKSLSSKATAILTDGAYIEYVSTANWQERRWGLFFNLPLSGPSFFASPLTIFEECGFLE